ncbi:MAG TPA: HD-GYP domain-containing protein [Chthonomonadaceae bacterium]|nr:HD-GYP domain-containing protein [Chthonomonadaceae bacterium]
MILTPISEIEDGVFVAKDIRDRDNRLLLKRGSQLTAPVIQLLRQLQVVAIYVEQEGTEDICAEDIVPAEVRVHCQVMIGEALKHFQQKANANGVRLDNQGVQEATYDLVEELLARKGAVFAMMDMRDWDNRLFQHSVNTAILATMIARQLRHSEEECKQLAMGMMFHDCGQLFLPREIFDKPGRISDLERAVVQQHARIGFQRTFRTDILSPMSAYIVLRHHERVDGTGYPDRLTADQIHPLARIAAVAEVFDAMTSIRTYGRPMMPDLAMRTILTQVGTAFDREVAIALVNNVAVYPTGSAVRLNTGERGIVVSTPYGSTTRPTVRLFFDAHGRRMPLEDINLAENREHLIVQSGASLAQVRAYIPEKRNIPRRRGSLARVINQVQTPERTQPAASG